jgi:hypothetical protein
VSGGPVESVAIALQELAELGDKHSRRSRSTSSNCARWRRRCSLSVVELRQMLEAALQKDEVRSDDLAAIYRQRMTRWNDVIEEGRAAGRHHASEQEERPRVRARAATRTRRRGRRSALPRHPQPARVERQARARPHARLRARSPHAGGSRSRCSKPSKTSATRCAARARSSD